MQANNKKGNNNKFTLNSIYFNGDIRSFQACSKKNNTKNTAYIYLPVHVVALQNGKR